MQRKCGRRGSPEMYPTLREYLCRKVVRGEKHAEGRGRPRRCRGPGIEENASEALITNKLREDCRTLRETQTGAGKSSSLLKIKNVQRAVEQR